MASPVLSRIALASLLAIGAAGCASRAPQPSVTVQLPDHPESAWRTLATAQDVDRLDRLAAAWSEALDAARGGGFSRAVAAEGALLDPDAGLGWAAPPPGSYRCRILRMGGPQRRRAFTAFNPFFCHIGDEGELLSFTKQTGSERPGGYLWEDGRERMVFLGSVALGREDSVPAYGEDRERDMIGVLERIGTFQWRLVLPWPRAEAAIDVIELVPVLPPELQRH